MARRLQPGKVLSIARPEAIPIFRSMFVRSVTMLGAVKIQKPSY
ncbi:MAG: hypothetical protein AABX62_01105 [Thermoproteota archaeon]